MKKVANMINKGFNIVTTTIADGTYKYTLSNKLIAAYSKSGLSSHIATFWRINAMRQLDRELRELRYSDAVVVEFGGEVCDFDWTAISAHPDKQHKPRTSVTNLGNAYRRVVNRIQRAGKNPVLLTIPTIETNYFFTNTTNNLNAGNILTWLGGDIEQINEIHEQYNDELNKVSKTLDVPIIDTMSIFKEKNNRKDYYRADGIHLNESGDELVADAIRNFRF